MNGKAKFLAASFSVLAFMSVSAVTQKTISLASFNSVELHSGGKIILRHGPTQRVTLIKGSPDCTSITIADGGRLVIDSRHKECPRGYELQVEIVTPDIARISVSNGGAIQSSGSFPHQTAIAVAVSNGGTIDIRSMSVDSVTAAVNSGGRIFTSPQTAMVASVVDGGIITYWGDARVVSSVKGGGVVTRGTAIEADKPLSELSSALPSVCPVPAVPPIQPVRNGRTWEW